MAELKRIGAASTEAMQGSLFKAETTWFHIFHDMIENGDVARMGPHAVVVYLVIKAHTNFKTGQSFPGIETIASKAGVSVAQVKRELKVLEDFGYILKERRGRNNFYTLREKVSVTCDGRPTAVATWDYIPDSVQRAVADLKNVLVNGFDGARIVHIETLNIQVVSGSNNVALQINESMNPRLRAALEGCRPS